MKEYSAWVAQGNFKVMIGGNLWYSLKDDMVSLLLDLCQQISIVCVRLRGIEQERIFTCVSHQSYGLLQL